MLLNEYLFNNGPQMSYFDVYQKLSTLIGDVEHPVLRSWKMIDRRFCAAKEGLIGGAFRC